MKHVFIDFHFVRDRVAKGQLRVAHVSTKDQLADALTKLISKQRLELLQSKIRVFSVLRGRVSDTADTENKKKSSSKSAFNQNLIDS